MLFTETPLAGLYILNFQPQYDERGYFARSFCKKSFEEKGLDGDFVQCNISYNTKAGTLRGLHYQEMPYGEAKIVSCRRGKIYDVVVDIRKQSDTFGECFCIELGEDLQQALYVPEGFAHGFQTLVDHTEVYYHMGNYYHPTAARGIRWNDQTLGIQWPIQDRIISLKDDKLPELHACDL